MSKRPRRRRKAEDVRLADHNRTEDFGNTGELENGEPKLIAGGPAFAKFNARIDRELTALVARWSHVAAPAASVFRRSVPQSRRRRSGQSL